jgi:hypothetical protein
MRTATRLIGRLVALAGCAPDPFSNIEATGFNALVNQAAEQCAPLQVGPMAITRNDDPPNYAAAQCGVWLDRTSNLYSERQSPEAYIQNIGNLFPGERTAVATRCPVSKLPPPEQRPNAPRQIEPALRGAPGPAAGEAAA